MTGRNLFLHAGSYAATLDEVSAIPTPDPTETHYPIPHRRLIDLVRENIGELGLQIKREEYGLWRDGNRMFGVLELGNGDGKRDYSLVAGVRNSHDKSFPGAFAVGSRVFVCDNLAFSGEIVIARKHTRFIDRDLPQLVLRAVGKLPGMRDKQDRRIEFYKETELDNSEAHDLMIRSMRNRIVAAARLPDVARYWHTPSHDEFKPRNVWSLFNCFTEAMKQSSAVALPRRTLALHGLMDQVCGVSFN
jgi:hypothetical protein